MRNDFESNYLAHHGILGQKWYHKNGPPYPLDAKDHSAAEKKAGWMKSLKSKAEAKKKEKKQKQALERARQAKAEKARQAQLAKEYEEKKQQVLQSGKASEVLKYKGQMTNKELVDAVNRIEWERKLASLSAAEVKTGWDKMDDLMGKVGKVTDYVNKGVNAYNAIDKALNLFSDDKGKGNNSGGNNDKKGGFDVDKVINSGNLKTIKKYEKQLSNKDLITALNRIENEKKLDNSIKEQKAEEKLAKEAKKAAKAEKRQDRMQRWDDEEDERLNDAISKLAEGVPSSKSGNNDRQLQLYDLTWDIDEAIRKGRRR